MSPVLRAQHVQWFRTYMPGFRQVMDRASPNVRAGLAGIFDPVFGTDDTSTAVTTTTTDSSTNWADLVKNLGTAASQYMLTSAQIKANQQITNLQLQRAQQGLPPLSMTALQQQYGISTTPSANVGITPDTKNFLMIAGIGLGVLWLLTRR
jgi:hypothetical protein